MVCFTTDAERRLFLGLLEELAGPCGCSIHAYVLMSNHVHLLLTPERKESASLLMKRLCQRYSLNFNKNNKRVGYLWQGRFYSNIVDSDEYLLRCHRYIELNPVRARMTHHPAEYSWSSYRSNAEGEASSVVHPHARYLALGTEPAARQSAYRRLFDVLPLDREIEEIRSACKKGIALGSDSFRQELETLTGKRVGPDARVGRKTSVATASNRIPPDGTKCTSPV